jgi:autotransporter translocation and assembly factor TamB
MPIPVGYDGKTYFASLKQLSTLEKSGFRVKQLSANVRYTDTGAVVKNLALQTNANQLQGEAAISYRSIATISSNPGQTKINAAVRNGKLLLDELLYFQPDLRNNASVRPLLGKTFYLNTTVNGTLDKLKIPSLTLKQANTYLQASADIYNLPDTKKLLIDLHLKEFTGLRKELLALLPPNTIPDSLLHYIPEKFTIKGTYKGTTQDMFADLQLTTSDGNIAIRGTLKDITDKNKARYDLVASTSNLQLNKLLQDTLFGPVSARVKVKGRGLDIYKADAVYDVVLEKGVYQRYQYHDLTMNGNIAAGKLQTQIQSGDPNLLLTSNTEYDLSKQNGSLKTNTRISNLDLFKLNFAQDTFTIRGDINGNFPNLDTSKINGDLFITSLSVQSSSQKYNIDSIMLNAKYASDTQSIILKAPFIDATLSGQYTLQSIPAAIKTITNRYIYTKSEDTLYSKRVVALLKARVRLPDSMMALIPGLKYLDPFTAELRINTDSSKLSFNTSVIEKIVFNQYEIDSLYLLARNSTRSVNYNTLFYNFGFKSLTSPSFTMAHSRTLGTINHGIIKGRVALSDLENRLRYNIPYSITNDPVEPYLKIGDSLLLDRKLWTVNENNIIYLDLKALKGTNLQIARNEQSILIIADSSQAAGLPLSVRLNNFELRNVSDIFVSDTTLVNGTVNGQAYFENFDPATFTTDITIDSLKVKSVNAGRFTAKVSRKTTDNFDVDVQLKGKNNDATFKGEYSPDTKLADFKLNLAKFDVQTAEPFVQEYLSMLKGNVRGEMAITGNLDKPSIRGTIQMDTIETLYKEYGSIIKIPTAGLNFTEEGVNFNNFIFTDSAGSKASLNGMVSTRDYKSFKFDLRLKADNFLAIGARKSRDQNIYGPTYVDALLTLKGGSDEY